MKTRLFAFLLAVLSLSVLLCGCAQKNPLAYQNTAATAEIRIISGENTAVGLLTLSAMPQDGSPCDLTLTFSSPESLAGMRIERKSGNCTVSLGELSIPTDSESGFFTAADLFSINATLTSAVTVELDGKKLTRVRLSGGSSSYEIYISKNNTPVRIIGNNLTVEVVWFEFLT